MGFFNKIKKLFKSEVKEDVKRKFLNMKRDFLSRELNLRLNWVSYQKSIDKLLRIILMS